MDIKIKASLFAVNIFLKSAVREQLWNGRQGSGTGRIEHTRYGSSIFVLIQGLEAGLELSAFDKIFHFPSFILNLNLGIDHVLA